MIFRGSSNIRAPEAGGGCWAQTIDPKIPAIRQLMRTAGLRQRKGMREIVMKNVTAW